MSETDARNKMTFELRRSGRGKFFARVTAMNVAILGLCLLALPAAAVTDLLGRTSVTIGWTSSPGDIVEYDVFRSCGEAAITLEYDSIPYATVNPADREFTLHGFYGGMCQLRVRGRDANGHVSPASISSSIFHFVEPDPPTDDFDLDGISDVLLQDPVTGDALILSGSNVRSGGNLDQNLQIINSSFGPNWTILGSGDFDGDGEPEYLLRFDDTNTGRSEFWVGSDASNRYKAAEYLTGKTDVVAIGDFDGNQIDDFVFWERERGIVFAVFLYYDGQAGSSSSFHAYPAVDPNRFSFAAAGDFNGDGRHDLLWQRYTPGASEGLVSAWLFQDGGRVEMAYSAKRVGPGWYGEAAGNFNNWPADDVIWRNPATGDVMLWYLDDVTNPKGLGETTGSGDDIIPAGKSDNWSIISTGDMNGDGRSDLTWHNSNTNLLQLWIMDEQEGSGYFIR